MNTVILWLYKILVSWIPESRGCWIKCFILRLAGAHIGSNVRIYSSVSILGAGQLAIEDDVHIGSGVLLYVAPGASITIRSHVDIAPRVTVITGTHEISLEGDHIGGKGMTKSVVIGCGCWLGANSTILPGVELGCKTVVAAGAVVSRAPAEGTCLLAGVPAILKRRY